MAHLVEAELAEKAHAGVEAAVLARDAQRKLGLVPGLAQGVPRALQVLQQPPLILVPAVQGHLDSSRTFQWPEACCADQVG